MEVIIAAQNLLTQKQTALKAAQAVMWQEGAAGKSIAERKAAVFA